MFPLEPATSVITGATPGGEDIRARIEQPIMEILLDRANGISAQLDEMINQIGSIQAQLNRLGKL